MRKEPIILLGLTAAACASSTPPPEEESPLLHETTLQRYDSTPIALEELESVRYSAMATADTIARAERELAEPWAELRSPEVIIQDLTSRYPTDTRLAINLWEGAEPVGRGHGRECFREYGWFCSQVSTTMFAPRPRPATLESFVAELLKTHSDQDPTHMLLAAWRRFAPMMGERAPCYLASSWQFELDYIEPVLVSLSESLLGPHLRCGVGRTGASFPGPAVSVDGYSTSEMLVSLLVAGPQCPVAEAIAAMSQASMGEEVPLPFSVASGEQPKGDEFDARFLQSALRGLRQGACQPVSLPASVRKFSVTFSYMVDQAEAQANLSFARTSEGWRLETFDYQPAAAALVGGSATLDLMPAVRDLAARNRRG